MVFIYSSYQKYCVNLQKEVQENIPIPIPTGALEGVLNTAFISFGGNLILSKGQLQPAIKGMMWGLSIKLLELVTWISYKMLQDYSANAQLQTASDTISTRGKMITMVVSGIGFLGVAYYFKISKIGIIVSAALILLRKAARSETTEILFLKEPIIVQTFGDYLRSLHSYRSIL